MPETASAATPASIERAAAALAEAARTATPCPPIRDLLPAGDLEAAYTVQNRLTAQALERGRRIVGRKIGLTSVAVQKQLGVDQPDYGMLFDDMAFGDGEPIPWSRLPKRSFSMPRSSPSWSRWSPKRRGNSLPRWASSDFMPLWPPWPPPVLMRALPGTRSSLS